ncbi:MAG: methionyl-tRNA formyltransferase [Caldimicrobium sp.]
MEKFRTLFFGTPEFVLPVLNFLWEKEILLGVVTQPDKPKGRGLEPTPSPVKTWALEHNLKILEPAKLKEETFLLTLKEINPDLIVVFAYGKILPKEVLEIPKEGCWNIHLSLLPKYRGASPVQWALLNGEKETGVTIMLMDEGMDTGPILLQKKLPIEDDDTTPILLKKLGNLSAEALKEALSLYKKGKLEPIPQPQEEVSYAPLIKKEDGLVNFRDPAELIVRKIKAFTPWPGIFTFFKGKILKIHSAEVKDLDPQGKTPGEILKIEKEGLYIVTSSKVLLLKEVQLEGKKKISAYDFAQGFHLKVGDTLN